ncbi:MAG TPA: 3-deoxy-D-manno-octulosonic acid transferase [Alphaproteobacteria bacterium]|nr:3-deoxy-D-manno-octulosonic acid transferase [Alphaproteobacteria bacterium]HAJ45360.1 3-deoxy-D-manno-octulosonic acid transferase [Alphaproteobacteria bacterium]
MTPVVAKRSTLLALYRGATSLAGPVAGLILRRRAAGGKEDPARLHERLGAPQRPRPPGALIWVHAASVGESVSVLPLVRAILEERSDAHVMVTTGTVTSARLMANQLPSRAFHQFVPVDLASSVDGFLSHWRPDLALWVESELWPNMILETSRRGIAMALVSARLSDGSFKTWGRAPAAASQLLNAFQVILPQDVDVRDRLKSLGAHNLGEVSNLKLWAEPLSADPAALDALQAQIGTRPLWLAASTHEGEELLAARLHRSLAHDISGLLTLIVPRHPKRGDDIATALRQEGFALARRSQGEPIGPQTALYLADTLGEMGLFYRVAPVVLMGKTLIGQGGQNPLEPARLGAAILSGPHIGNFDAVFMMLAKAKGAEILPDSTQVEVALRRLLGDPAAARAMGGRAQAVAGDPRPLLQTMEALRPMLRSLPLDARP